MTWFANSANQTEATKSHVELFIAVDFDFPSGHQRFWSGLGDLEIDGQTYIGTGVLGKVSYNTDRPGLVIETKSYVLSGVDPTVVPESEIDQSFGRPVTEYFGFIDQVTRQKVADPEIGWEGRIDTIRRVDGDEPIIAVNAENRFVVIDRADGWRSTHEHQQQFYPGDLGFNLIAKCEARELIWGGVPVQAGAIRNGRQIGGGTAGNPANNPVGRGGSLGGGSSGGGGSTRIGRPLP